MTLRVEIGVFAHDEAKGIAAMLRGLVAQDIFSRPGLEARVTLLANGCHDDTAARARALCIPSLTVVDLPEGGKARTWNRFVHDLSAPGADILIFVDADIWWTVPDALSRLALGLAARPELWALSSRPVKDITLAPKGLSPVARMIAASAGGLDDWRRAICGQLYAMPAARARTLRLPLGLPVEDGFLRALILTGQFTGPEDLSRIDGLEEVFHLYPSERRLWPLIRHQRRLVIGGAVNAAIFARLARLPQRDRAGALATAARDEDWLPHLLREDLPHRPWGYVPTHFLVKRLVRPGAGRRGARGVALLLLGLGFDAIVYVLAQVKMARGTGAGHW